MKITKEMFVNTPDWVESINVSPDGLAYGFNCRKGDCYFDEKGYFEFKKDFNGSKMSIFLGGRFEYIKGGENVIERDG